MGKGVEVDCLVGYRQGMRAGVDLDDVWLVEVWCSRCGGGELGRELTEAEVLALRFDETERGGVPEAGGPAVAKQHLVALWEAEEIAQSRANLPDH